MTNELITVLANLALTLSFIVAVIFGIAQVRAAGRDRRERLTLETVRSFQTREFSELMVHISTHDLPTTYENWQALPASDKTVYLQFAQEMESLGILVAERLINIDLVEKTLGSFVITSWEKYKPAFSEMRQKLPDPYLGEYFQWLAERLGVLMRKKPRKPFYET
ncbi:MAG TPA: hypothetical protein VI215_05760 [Bacteroidota bacterium]|jgi:hypothetical protein